ncbi:subtype B tannase [Brevundimonas sp. SL130]|uniref:subtype B tannase n=1 Tax=Brevundimonas sp. SL130 TaxID=2995143 RepID=UPI00226D11A9|nr:subtype B tannase [Brevundimonas sp. SL130]WAC58762.1 alpha/beta hydrolase fold domain-containing protein [Brevundimonas sp. SL130]
MSPIRRALVSSLATGLALWSGAALAQPDTPAQGQMQSQTQAPANGGFDAALRLDPTAYTRITVTVDGAPLMVRRYRATYVAKPVALAAEQPSRKMGPGGSPSGAASQTLQDPLTYQSLYVFVPEGASETAAIILNVNNAGWFASELRAGITDGGVYSSTSDTDKAGAALAAGYVYVDVGTRGRGLVGADGGFPGHAPAAVVDTKAAIRWLRLNDGALAGSAERIVVTGTSGGGGLSAVVAASGDSRDFLPFLTEIGAAGVAADGRSTLSDRVFAVIAYCPITDLGHADMAYEWLYRDVRAPETTAGGVWGAAQAAASAELAAGYPAYLAGLELTLADGRSLTTATMPEAVARQVALEVERHIAAGGAVPALGDDFQITLRGFGPGGGRQVEIANDWLEVADGKVTRLDLANFLRFVAKTAALKPVPAFDRTGNTGNGADGENTLFGAADQSYSNFTPYGWANNTVAGDGSGPDDTGMSWSEWTAGPGAGLADQVRLIDPLTYLGQPTAAAAPFWYVRHGMIDRDTGFTVGVVLSRAAAGDADVKQVNFATPWMTPHSGDYDVQEAYGWLKSVLE